MWALGAVHRGAWAPRFWSSPGCLFHHAYPPGYRASKAQHFGRTFAMSIVAGPTGPIFQVHLNLNLLLVLNLFGRTFAMSIAAGPTRPIFQVHPHVST